MWLGKPAERERLGWGWGWSKNKIAKHKKKEERGNKKRGLETAGQL